MSRAAHLVPIIFAALSLAPNVLHSQELPSTADHVVLPPGTSVKLQVSQTISSAHARRGDQLRFVVMDDVVAGGFTVIRAGAPASGSIIGVKGKRPLGMGGNVTLQLDSVELANGERAGLLGRQEFKGRSHTIRMGVAMAITAAIYLPVAPVFLLSRGSDSIILKGTALTAVTNSVSSFELGDLPFATGGGSQISEMMNLLPSRVLNGEGREGDMLNLIFLGNEGDLRATFARAGWLPVEKSKPQIIWHLLLHRQYYTKLPMDRLFVFGRAQDYSYALPDPASIVARRHHLRIWKTDRSVDGIPLWVAAATHDVSIEFVLRKLRLFHRIDPNVDAEREFIAGNLAETRQVGRVEYLSGAAPVFKAETATGQAYYSDSRLLLLELNGGKVSVAGATSSVPPAALVAVRSSAASEAVAKAEVAAKIQ